MSCNSRAAFIVGGVEISQGLQERLSDDYGRRFQVGKYRPYDDVSEGREVSFIMASNGPLLYRLNRRNPDPPENRGN